MLPGHRRRRRGADAQVGDGELSQLIGLAFECGGRNSQTAKLVQLLLTDEADERLEPLRLTLRLQGDAYREGIFAWKGFLYYSGRWTTSGWA